MYDFTAHKAEILSDGFTVVQNIYNSNEIDAIISAINNTDQSNITFRKTDDLFAIRQFLGELPQLKQLIFNDNLRLAINNLFGTGYFIVKSIYFDKPEKSNWFVAWHQDLTIAVDKKAQIPDYTNWTAKLSQFAVQPPVEILQDNFTVRIHLDDTNGGNGALKVLPGSHLKNICRVENMDLQKETTCSVKSGHIMIMKPLLMHASSRTTTNHRRRVIHIEFSKAILPIPIDWAEKTPI